MTLYWLTCWSFYVSCDQPLYCVDDIYTNNSVLKLIYNPASEIKLLFPEDIFLNRATCLKKQLVSSENALEK